MTGPTLTHATDDWPAMSSLSEPTRRAIYDYVVSVGHWVGRDQTSDATGLEASLEPEGLCCARPAGPSS